MDKRQCASKMNNPTWKFSENLMVKILQQLFYLPVCTTELCFEKHTQSERFFECGSPILDRLFDSFGVCVLLHTGWLCHTINLQAQMNLANEEHF